jgi:hypothetical protein
MGLLLLRIKSLYMFRKLLAHPQETLHKRQLVYWMRVMSVSCTSSTPFLVQPTDITRTQYTKKLTYKVDLNVKAWPSLRSSTISKSPKLVALNCKVFNLLFLSYNTLVTSRHQRASGISRLTFCQLNLASQNVT